VTKTALSRQYMNVGPSIAMTKAALRRQFVEVSDLEGAAADVASRVDESSFDAVYAAELDYVWRTLGRLGVPPADIADAAHDVFVVVYRKWDEIDRERPVRPFLFGVARRVAATARRKPRPESDNDVERVVDAPPHAERDLLWRALAALDDDRRAVIILHDLEGYTGAEIATILDIPANTVHSRLRLARADLVAAHERLQGGRP
jgi:RNA polymerase sigma-70 factor, ECF subfamily